MALGRFQSLTTLVLMQQFDPALMLELIETEKADMATGVSVGKIDGFSSAIS